MCVTRLARIASGVEVACTEKEAEVMKKLLDLTAKKRNRFGLFTWVSRLEGCTLKVWCEWEDMPIVVSILSGNAQTDGAEGEKPIELERLANGMEIPKIFFGTYRIHNADDVQCHDPGCLCLRVPGI
ncbi:MAG: hypothetical protein V8Q43_00600 [Christensenellaceae bacterium]